MRLRVLLICIIQTVDYYRSFQNNLNAYRALSKVHPPKAVEIVSLPAEQWQDLECCLSLCM